MRLEKWSRATAGPFSGMWERRRWSLVLKATSIGSRVFVLIALLCFCVGGLEGLAFAQEGDDPYAYEADLKLDGAVLTMSLALALGSELVVRGDELPAAGPQPHADLMALDQWAADQDGPRTWAKVTSDSLVASAWGFAVLDSVLTGVDKGGDAGLTDGVIYAEVALLSWALSDVVKIGVRRPRPRTWYRQRMGEVPIQEGDDALSFYSLHTAMAAGMATAATSLSFGRGDPEWRSWTTLGVGAALTATVAYLRVRAMAHFPSDVIVGGLMGFGMGLLVPLLHERSGSEIQTTNQGLSHAPTPLIGGQGVTWGVFGDGREVGGASVSIVW